MGRVHLPTAASPLLGLTNWGFPEKSFHFLMENKFYAISDGKLKKLQRERELNRHYHHLHHPLESDCPHIVSVLNGLE